MKSKYYILAMKTGDAELKALENINSDKKIIFPIIELTRGRKSKYDSEGSLNKRLDKVKSIFNDHNICLDLTTSDRLTNTEINNLYSYNNGYEKWIDFLVSLKKGKFFSDISPVILVNSSDPDLNNNLKSQVDNLVEKFDSIVYRNSLSDDACYSDLENIKDIVIKSRVKFYFIIDCEYISPGAWKRFAEKAIVRIEKVRKLISNTHFIILSTSFPNNVSEIGDEYGGTIELNEINLYNEICSGVESLNIHYGDYGSINPIRNDDIIMSRGWVPHIDVALLDRIFYIRDKRKYHHNDYSSTYNSIAERIISDPRFPKTITSNWGIRQINKCADGNSPGSRPSFWISVRMNMHIEQQVKRLGLAK
jgi:hypothetical protein